MEVCSLGMKNLSGFLLVILIAIAISGCFRSAPIVEDKTTGTRGTGIIVEKIINPEYKPILTVCNKILEGQKTHDKNKVMSAVAIDSPDYKFMLKATENLIEKDMAIDSYNCSVSYLKGDTARTNITLRVKADDKILTNNVVWTFKDIKNNWYFWHGQR